MDKTNLYRLLDNNDKWVKRSQRKHPDLFENLAYEQAPHYLWIGCSDSRVPAETLLGLLPGEIFVHRNIGNLVNELDINTQSVIEYAVTTLKVSDIIVCGHSDCGAIQAAVSNQDLGIMNHWLASIKHVYQYQCTHRDLYEEDLATLTRLNIIQQVKNVCRTAAVQHAWANQQPLIVHGLLNDVSDGRLYDLNVSVDSPSSLEHIYRLDNYQERL